MAIRHHIFSKCYNTDSNKSLRIIWLPDNQNHQKNIWSIVLVSLHKNVEQY
jgi:hypothetical protein